MSETQRAGTGEARPLLGETRRVGINEARPRLGLLADDVAETGKPVVLTRRGRDAAVLVGAGFYAQAVQALMTYEILRSRLTPDERRLLDAGSMRLTEMELKQIGTR